MANHPNRRRYKVWPLPGSSDTDAYTAFAVSGHQVEYFAKMDELAKIMQRALNEPAAVMHGYRRRLRAGHRLRRIRRPNS